MKQTPYRCFGIGAEVDDQGEFHSGGFQLIEGLCVMLRTQFPDGLQFH